MYDKKLKVINLYNYKEYIPQVADWIFSEFIHGHIDDCSHSDIVDALKKRKEYTIPMTLIGLLGDECVGTISLFSNDLKKRPELSPWLAALYIEEKYRNRGYAKILMSHIEKVTAASGFSKLYLRTETAGNYYVRNGWYKLEDIVDENGIETAVYEKQC